MIERVGFCREPANDIVGSGAVTSGHVLPAML
jgi:hypothetical protein